MRILTTLLLFISFHSFAQTSDSLKKKEPLKATANILITNNGISLFPNLMLGKPATILSLSVGKKNIYFEPELRWGLDGKPWSYIYWLRYKFRKSQKFGFNTGVHPAYTVKEIPFDINGKQEIRFVSLRFFAGEFVPTYYFSKKFSLGVQYLYSRGLDNYETRDSHFFSFQPKFSNIPLSKEVSINFNPQVFHLILDSQSGTYFSEYLSINKKNLPLYLGSIFTYKISSTIPGDNVVWNVSLNYRL